MMLNSIAIYLFCRLESFFKPVPNTSAPIKRKVCLRYAFWACLGFFFPGYADIYLWLEDKMFVCSNSAYFDEIIELGLLIVHTNFSYYQEKTAD